MANEGRDGGGRGTAEKTPRRKRDLIATAVDLFNRFGFRRVTVEEICSEAGASKATFYKYFSNKNALVKHILQKMSERYHRKVDEVEAMGLSFVEKVRILVDDQLEQTRRTSDAFIEDFYRINGELTDTFDGLMRRNQSRFLDFIAEAQQRGDVRSDIRHAFILAMLGKFNELLADETLRRAYPDYESLTREIVDFFFYGIFPAAER